MTPEERVDSRDRVATAKYVFVYSFKRLNRMPIDSIFDGTFFDDGHWWDDQEIPHHTNNNKRRMTP